MNFYLLSDSCSGHTAVSISKSKVIVFGGFIDNKFLNDTFVYDIGIALSLGTQFPRFIRIIILISAELAMSFQLPKYFGPDFLLIRFQKI